MKKSLSLSSANLLYLLTMLLVITAGSIVQGLNLSLGLIATEFVLILLPAMIFLRVKKIPLKEALRIGKIRPSVAATCLFMGISTYLFSVLIENVMMQISGQPPVIMPASSMPKGTTESIFYFLALALAAPLCEESLFRGAVQGSYEAHKSTTLAIVIPALMFAFYHFRLSGLPGLLPVAFLLGYVAWRTRSIVGTILIHIGMNASAAVVTLLSLNSSDLPTKLLSKVWIYPAALLLTIILLFLFIKLQPKPASEESALEETRKSWFVTYWPLFAGFLLYAVVVISPFMLPVSQQNAITTLNFYPPHIETPIESRYQAVNRAGDVVGEMDCTITPHGETFSLDCGEDIDAYEVTIENSMWSDSGHTANLHVVWDSQTFQVLEYRNTGTYDSGGEQTSELKNGNLVTTSFFDSYDPLQLTGTPLFEHEWAWKVYDLDGTGGPLFKTPFVYLMRWNEEIKKSIPVMQDEILKLEGDETITVPAGEFKTWKVTMGSQAAWYLADDPGYPRPIQFDDGMLIYSLMK